MLKKKTNKLSQEQISDNISLALSDDVSFDNIKKMYDINSDEIKRVMKDNGLDPKLISMDHAASYRAIKNGNIKSLKYQKIF